MDGQKLKLILYNILQALTAVGMIAGAAIKWIKYCLYEFGLNKVDEVDSAMDDSYDDIPDINDACDQGDFDVVDGEYCDNFCDNVEKSKPVAIL